MKEQSAEGRRLANLMGIQARHNYNNYREAMDRWNREFTRKEKRRIAMKRKKERLVSNPGAFRADVGNCARCGRDHQSVLFVPFTRPPRWWTHYADCPRTKEPILMRQTED